MHGPDEVDGEVGTSGAEVLQYTSGFLRSIEMAEGRQEDRVARPLKARLAQCLPRPRDGLIVFPHEQVGVRGADQERSHVGIPRTQFDSRTQGREGLTRSSAEDQRGTDPIVRPREARIQLEG